MFPDLRQAAQVGVTVVCAVFAAYFGVQAPTFFGPTADAVAIASGELAFVASSSFLPLAGGVVRTGAALPVTAHEVDGAAVVTAVAVPAPLGTVGFPSGPEMASPSRFGAFLRALAQAWAEDVEQPAAAGVEPVGEAVFAACLAVIIVAHLVWLFLMRFAPGAKVGWGPLGKQSESGDRVSLAVLSCLLTLCHIMSLVLCCALEYFTVCSTLFHSACLKHLKSQHYSHMPPSSLFSSSISELRASLSTGCLIRCHFSNFAHSRFCTFVRHVTK